MLNNKPFQKLEGSRRSAFEKLEKAELLPLPATPYVLAEWRKAKVNIDYHIEIEMHFLIPRRTWRAGSLLQRAVSTRSSHSRCARDAIDARGVPEWQAGRSARSGVEPRTASWAAHHDHGAHA